MSEESAWSRMQEGRNAARGWGMPPSPAGDPVKYQGYLSEKGIVDLEKADAAVGPQPGAGVLVGLIAIGVALYYVAAIATILVMALLVTAISILLLSQKFAVTNPIRFRSAIKISVVSVFIYGALTGIAGYLAFFELDPGRFSLGSTMMAQLIHELHYMPEQYWYGIKSLAHFKQAIADTLARTTTPTYLAVTVISFLILVSPGAIASGAYLSKRAGPPFSGKMGFLWACLFTVLIMIVVSFLVACANSGLTLLTGGR